MAYLKALDGGSAGGGFKEWRESPAGRAAAATTPRLDYTHPAASYLLPTPAPAERAEPIVPRGSGGDVVEIEATLSRASPFARGRNLTLTSADASASIASVDDLLAALEGMGVTNARIEVEAGGAQRPAAPLDSPIDTRHLEVPAGDGSALPWSVHIQRVGVVPAAEAGTAAGSASSSAGRVAASAPRVSSPLSFTNDSGAYAAYIPDGTPAITAGVGADTVPVVGRQWASWTPTVSQEPAHHFRWRLAPARGFAPSSDAILEARFSDGMFRAGSTGVLLVAAGDAWTQPRHERFPGDEPARNAAAHTLAALSLLAAPGGSGLPDGHVIAYNADADLLLRLVGGLAERCAYGEA